MAEIKAVIFDMDGVLIDAREWHYEALNRALRAFGFEISRADHLSSYDGLPTRKKLERLSAERGLPRGLHSVINRIKQQHTMELAHANCRPRFQHQYALARLRSAGYRLAVCSNSIRASVEVMIDRAGIREFFEFMLSAEDVREPKPHPEMYETAIKRLDLSPHECLVVEDNEHGIQSARAAGADVLTVRGVEDVTHEIIVDCIRKLERGPC